MFHWDHRHRQVRAEGPVEPLSDAENDAYFRTRAWQKPHRRLGQRAKSTGGIAPGSRRQRWPRARVASGFPTRARARLNPRQVDVDVPRPPHWGGYRLLSRMPWNCGWKVSSAFTIAHAGRAPQRSGEYGCAAGPSRACSPDPTRSSNDVDVAKASWRIQKARTLRRQMGAARRDEVHRQGLRLEVLQNSHQRIRRPIHRSPGRRAGAQYRGRPAQLAIEPRRRRPADAVRASRRALAVRDRSAIPAPMSAPCRISCRGWLRSCGVRGMPRRSR